MAKQKCYTAGSNPRFHADKILTRSTMLNLSPFRQTSGLRLQT